MFLSSSPRPSLRNARAFLIALLLLALGLPAARADSPLTVVLPIRDVNTVADQDFFYPLLKLSLDKTLDSHGPYTLVYHPVTLSSERIISQLQTGGPVNTMWSSTSERRESLLDFVPISLLGELSDHRVLLIRKSDQARFDKIAHVGQLRELRAGIGGHWPDARLLENNGFTTVTSIYYASLFKMLIAGRFDFFPRGLFEVKDDLELYGQDKLAIETGLLLHYPAPFYFFVSRHHPAIRERITLGLRRAQADGSYQALINKMPAFVFGQQLLDQPRTRFSLIPDYR